MRNWRADIGKTVFLYGKNRIYKSQIYGARCTEFLNTGSDQHGNLLDAVIEYQVKGDMVTSRTWVKAEKVYFSKQEILDGL